MRKKRCLLLLAVLCLPHSALAQQTQALRTVDDLVCVAIVKNRDLAATRARIEEARGQYRQAAVRPSPILQLTGTTGRPLGAANENQYAADLAQTIEAVGKRSNRISMADQAVLKAEATYQNNVAELTLALKATFAELIAERRKRDVMDKLLALHRQSLALTEARVKEGDVASLEARLLKVELSRATILRASVESRIHAAETDLRRQAGLVATEPLPDAIPVLPASGALDALQRKALTERSDLRVAQFDEAYELAGTRLARAEGRPDVTLSTGWSRQSSAFDGLNGITSQGTLRPIREQNSTLTFGVALPLRTGRSTLGNRQSAEARLFAARAHRQALEHSIPLEVESAWQRWQNAQRNAAQMQTEVLAPSAENLTVLEKAYKLGQMRMIDVLNEQRRYLDAQWTAIEAEQDAQRTWAELEHAAGGAL